MELKVKETLNGIAKQLGDDLKLIIHAGTPKTGTTSLQYCSENQRHKLLEQGVLYPQTDNSEFKHQWLIDYLLKEDRAGWVEEFSKIKNQLQPGINKIVLSTEGFYNHWWDIKPGGKAMMEELNEFFDVEILIWFREPVSFSESLYKQYIINNRNESFPCYSRSFSLNKMLHDPWFIQRLDYWGFMREAKEIFGMHSVKNFSYGRNTVKEFCEYLGVSNIENISIPAKSKNKSVSFISILFLRIINIFPLNSALKQKLVKLITKINNMLPIFMNFPITGKRNRVFIEKISAGYRSNAATN